MPHDWGMVSINLVKSLCAEVVVQQLRDVVSQDGFSE
jgi:hypothetical protein